MSLLRRYTLTIQISPNVLTLLFFFLFSLPLSLPFCLPPWSLPFLSLLMPSLIQGCDVVFLGKWGKSLYGWTKVDPIFNLFMPSLLSDYVLAERESFLKDLTRNTSSHDGVGSIFSDLRTVSQKMLWGATLVVLVRPGCYTKIPQNGSLQATEMQFSQFWRLHVQDQVASIVTWGASSGLLTSCCALT